MSFNLNVRQGVCDILADWHRLAIQYCGLVKLAISLRRLVSRNDIIGLTQFFNINRDIDIDAVEVSTPPSTIGRLNFSFLKPTTVVGLLFIPRC